MNSYNFYLPSQKTDFWIPQKYSNGDFCTRDTWSSPRC